MQTMVTAVTGCLGFMGSHFTRACLSRGWHVWGIDKMTYASNLRCLKEFQNNPLFKFTKEDIRAMQHLSDVDIVVNFAAETHVDNSIMDSANFVQTNICGVENLLELIRSKRNYEMPLLIQVSTDEVYGDIENGLHTEQDRLQPSNPYSSSKAAADLLILGWHRTHHVPYIIIRPTNNYGLDQYPEKLIPKAVKYLTLGKPIPVHGDGSYRRTWLHAQDTAAGILTVIDRGERNTIYNMAGNDELPNLEIIKKIINYYFDGAQDQRWQEFVKQNFIRMGEDVRYSLDDAKLRALGWNPQRDLNQEIRALVDYYKNHFIW
ncbi:MAG: GDP-mannose 4,6-dehydratase [Candidatus Omnitrophica bacterium]|nr:GDP-mannose 4,6-dehydratase [Candidatus Omnitrophota bacterium]